MMVASTTAHTNRLARRPRLSAAAQARSGGLAALGAGGARRSEALRTNHSAFGRLRRLSLVPCDGARKLRGRGDARVMNELFVNIKVDREKRPGHRPDLHARAASSGEQGGWPLTMFLTPAASRSGAARTSREHALGDRLSSIDARNGPAVREEPERIGRAAWR